MRLVSTRLRQTLEHFFSRQARLETGDRLLVAFSGGPDSTALLLGLCELRRSLGIEVEAAHLDHALDPDSARRADVARELAETIGVPFRFDRSPLDPTRAARAGGLEATARAQRYRFLERERGSSGARFVVTAHHRDDQAETVLLRLLSGSGLRGLGAIRPVEGRLLRPLLSLPRSELARALEGHDLRPAVDPTNQWLGTARNRVRARLIPQLKRRHPVLEDSLVGLADATRNAMRSLDRRLDALLAPRPATPIPGVPGGILVRRASLEELPTDLMPLALGYLHRRAGAPLPATKGARAELLRQMSGSCRVGCDAGSGWKWEGSGAWYSLRKKARPIGVFSYTCSIPGSLSVPELDLVVRVERHVHGADPELPKSPGWTAVLRFPRGIEEVRLRNRRSGDRIQPMSHCESGFPPFLEATCSEEGENRSWLERDTALNEMLARVGVPPSYRDCVPLLCLGDRIAWLPGLAEPGPRADRARDLSIPDHHYEALRVHIESSGREPEPTHPCIFSEGLVTTGAAPSR